MDNNEWLEVSNINKLVNFSRRLVYYNFDDEADSLSDEDFLSKVNKIKPEDKAEMDRLLPFDEAKTILISVCHKKRHKKTKVLKIYMKDSEYDEVLVQLNQRMVSNIVRGLVNKGVLDAAFDDEKNDFIFWVKDKEDYTDEETPETD